MCEDVGLLWDKSGHWILLETGLLEFVWKVALHITIYMVRVVYSFPFLRWSSFYNDKFPVENAELKKQFSYILPLVLWMPNIKDMQILRNSGVNLSFIQKKKFSNKEQLNITWYIINFSNYHIHLFPYFILIQTQMGKKGKLELFHYYLFYRLLLHF